MKRIMLVISGILIMSCLAFGQVDTMRLAEVGSVVAPGNITNWYFQDLNGDSIKEIILTTANSVNIYNGQTFSPIWSQDGFTNPRDLNFADINNDGLIDFSVKDTLHIYLIDPHHSTTIWTSPMLDSLYRCYTIGDRNGDGWVDAAIVTQEPFVLIWDMPDTDTVYVNSFSGPTFQNGDSYLTYCINTSHFSQPSYGSVSKEFASTVLFAILSDSSGIPQNRILLFTKTTYSYSFHGGMSGSSYSGKLKIIDYLRQSTLENINIGAMDYQYSYSDLSSQKLSILSNNSSYSNSPYSANSNHFITSIVADDVLTINSLEDTTVHNIPSWKGFMIGGLIDSINQKQLCYGRRDSLFLISLTSASILWSIGGISDLASVNFGYMTPASSNHDDYVVCKSTATSGVYKFFVGESGYLRYILPTGNIVLLGTVDLYSVHTDNLYSVTGNSLHFYTLAPRTGIDDPEAIPSAFFLSSNYPNPFNSSTLIEYGLPLAGLVKVDIFDILGRKIQTLVDETQAAGYHQVTWKADNVPSGMYFYRIQAGDNTQTRKCLLIK